MVADNRAGDRSVNTMAASSGSPAVRVANTDFRFCSRGEWGRTFFFDRPRGDAPVRPRGHGATHRVRQAHVRLFAANTPRPRQYIARSHSLTAAFAPTQSAGGLFRIGFDKNPGQSFRPTHPMASSMPPPSLVSRNMIHPQIDRRDAFLTKNMKEYDTNLSSNTKTIWRSCSPDAPLRRASHKRRSNVRSEEH